MCKSNEDDWKGEFIKESELLDYMNTHGVLFCGDLIKHNYSISKIGRCIPCNRQLNKLK